VATAFDTFLRLHEGLTKQAPGSDASTARALALVRGLPERPEVLDLGAGPGRQTLALARLTRGRVTAVDLHEPFLEQLRDRAAEAGFGSAVRAVRASIDALPLPRAAFDLVWSEGAAYAIGFDRALALWRPLLRPGGSLAITELTWLREERAPGSVEFWGSAYPSMRRYDENLAAIERAGYVLRGDFALPASDWWDGYYDVLAARIPRLRSACAGDPEATSALDEAAREIEVFRGSSGCYGYVFFVASLPG
jgi:SAM-dependent methyltransferase